MVLLDLLGLVLGWRGDAIVAATLVPTGAP